MTRRHYMRDVHQLARELGYNVSPTRGGHLRLDHPLASAPVFAASTPSDYRTILNLRAELRRHVARLEVGERGRRV